MPVTPGTPSVESVTDASASVVTTAAAGGNGGPYSYGLQWNTEPDFGGATVEGGLNRSRRHVAAGLAPATTYYFRFFVTDGTEEGEAVSAAASATTDAAGTEQPPMATITLDFDPPDLPVLVALTGLRRADTEAAIALPDPPDFAHAGDGVWAISFEEPEPGLRYAYEALVTWGDGTTTPFAGTADGTAAAESVLSYLTRSQAAAVAAALPASMLSAWLDAATTDAQRMAALEQATADVDAGGPYQGRRYDPDQELEFPRAAYETRLPSAYPYGGRHGIADRVWDWDRATNTAVVPLNVKRAVVYQAESILQGTRGRQQDALHDRLASQSVGSLSESYHPAKTPDEAIAGPGVLCRPAAQLLARYRLRTGRLL